MWFIARDVRLNLHYLEQRMRQSGHWKGRRKLTQSDLGGHFDQKIEKLDIAAAKEDIVYFIKDTSQLDLWSKAFFSEVTQQIKIL